MADAVALFINPGERDLTAEQWLEVASSLPLGISRAEMQQIFLKVDVADTGRISLTALEGCIGRVSAADCTTAPPWISAAMRRGLCGRIRDELRRLGFGSGASLAPESHFKRVVMQTERYLTSDQLSSLVLLADKSSNGLVDYQEFADRFDVDGAKFGVLRVPGGVMPPLPGMVAPSAGVAPVSDEEIRAVGSRTGAVLARQDLAPQRLPALIALWGGDVHLDDLAKILAHLPMGLSQREALAQLQAAGSLAAFVARLTDLRSEGAWAKLCEWAAATISGPSLRAVLQRQVIEAESRTLDPSEFLRALVDAGVKPPSAGPALWLAEKTEQGDICVAEFLTSFGGPPPAERKKKRGLLDRFKWR